VGPSSPGALPSPAEPSSPEPPPLLELEAPPSLPELEVVLPLLEPEVLPPLPEPEVLPPLPEPELAPVPLLELDVLASPPLELPVLLAVPLLPLDVPAGSEGEIVASQCKAELLINPAMASAIGVAWNLCFLGVSATASSSRLVEAPRPDDLLPSPRPGAGVH
jgi:hypothetical protein